MAFRNMSARVASLEGAQSIEADKPFLWFSGQSLDDALSIAGLTLADAPLLAIEIMGVKPRGTEPRCRLHERDRHMLEADHEQAHNGP